MLSFPEAPFPAVELYPNQFGNVSLDGLTLNASETDRFRFLYNSDGPLILQTTGSLDPVMAFYPVDGVPRAIRDLGGAGQNPLIFRTAIPVGEILHVAIQPDFGSPLGAYGLEIDGPANTFQTVAISSVNHDGQRLNETIGAGTDYDFYRFTPTTGGTWRIEVSPDAGFDVSIHVFDENGVPIAGDFDAPLNAGGRGVSEVVNIPVSYGESYFVRVDGVEEVAGDYDVLIAGPDPNALLDAPFPFFQTLYTNQKGFASTGLQSMTGPGYPDVYEVFLDNMGTVTVKSSLIGNPMEPLIAFYQGDGPADQLSETGVPPLEQVLSRGDVPGHQRH
ncbi:MAG: PPC domain-containing protein, partial [Planctomycetaceae bacterium]|nr:PPC domain-containing protein [Planctomycetaceae bacterium]